MKKNWLEIIDIPLCDHRLMIYTDKEGRKSFDQHVKFDYPEHENRDNVDGLNYNNHIWIEDISNKHVLLHEVSHFLEWLYEHMDCQNETEFKACLFSDIVEKVIKL